MPKQYYEEILTYSQSDDLRDIVKRWDTLSRNISSKPDLPILLPGMFWVSESGFGKTRLLNLIAEYLHTQGNLLSFYGSVKFFEFLVGYCRPDSDFSELRRFIDTVRQAAGFRAKYKGIVCINIDEWIGHEEEKHFFTLLEYLSGNIDNWLLIFCVSPRKNVNLQNMERILSVFFRIEKAVIGLPDTKSLMEYIGRSLGDYGLTITNDARKILSETIDLLREERFFDGYKTLKILCRDIVYSVYTLDKPKSVVNGKIASLFSKDSDYIKRVIQKNEKKGKIGF